MTAQGRAGEYAYIHARIRGRIGDMPSEKGWQMILNAGDLETTIEAMSGNGLQHWVNDFPRLPSPFEIERRCLVSLLGICLFVDAHLPARWKPTGRWLLQLPHVLQLRGVLSGRLDKERLLPGSPFTGLVSESPAQRFKSLQESEYAVYLGEQCVPESCWAARFRTTLPDVSVQEGYILNRLGGLLAEHFRGIEPDMAPDQVWLHRSALFERLKLALAGEPFHVGILLIYALLESIQFEWLTKSGVGVKLLPWSPKISIFHYLQRTSNSTDLKM